MSNEVVAALARHLMLGALLEELVEMYGGYQLVAHWTQGEFHHDLVLMIGRPRDLPGRVLLVASNCNGGIKEVMCFARVPSRYALWHARCPENPEFEGDLPEVLAQARTIHWCDPCELLSDYAGSALKPDCRRRQRGGGFEPLPSS